MGSFVGNGAIQQQVYDPMLSCCEKKTERHCARCLAMRILEGV
jgi:hypothetical protein